MSTLLIVIVNYRTADLVVDCLQSLAAELAGRRGWRAIVVDNASGDGSAEHIGAAIAAGGWRSWAELLPLARNCGFAAGNNAALRPIFDRPTRPDFVLLLNPDTVVRPGAIRALIAFMKAHPDAGIAGSRLEDPDGTPQRSAFRFPSAASELEDGLRIGIVSRWLGRWIVAPPVRDLAHRTDWVAGASMIVRREVFEEIGLLDERYFLYFEEVDFCLRARRVGWSCWYVPASRVVHLVGQSSGVTDVRRPRKRRPTYWFAARSHYFRQNYGRMYKLLADLCWLFGFSLWRLRRRVQEKTDSDPPGLLGDFFCYNFLPRDRTLRMNMNEPLPKGDVNQNPPGIGLWALLREDLRTHDGKLFEQGFWAVAVHRFGNWRMGVRVKVLRAPLTLLYRALNKSVEWTCGISLPYTTKLGRRVRIWHFGSMFLHARSIGDDVQLRQNTTFGVARTNCNEELPVIEDRADIGCGVCVLGAVTVGHDALIGANSVVVKDVPPGAVAVGAPARVIKRRMLPDVARRLSAV